MAIPESAEIFNLGNSDYSDIKGAYHSLWSFFRNIDGLEVRGTNNNLDISHKDGKVTVKGDGFLKIKGVGFEVGKSGGPIDICFKPNLTVAGVDYDGVKRPVIESSATAIAYLKVSEADDGADEGTSSDNKTPAEVLSAFHYDFEMDPDERHPVFHAQYEPSSIQIGTLVSEYDIQNETHVTNSFPNHPRVPTAPLDFAGVLCMLVQEHIDSFDTAWPGRTIQAVAELPKIPAWCFEPDPLCRGALLPEWWYLLAQGESELSDDVIESRGIY